MANKTNQLLQKICKTRLNMLPLDLNTNCSEKLNEILKAHNESWDELVVEDYEVKLYEDLFYNKKIKNSDVYHKIQNLLTEINIPNLPLSLSNVEPVMQDNAIESISITISTFLAEIENNNNQLMKPRKENNSNVGNDEVGGIARHNTTAVDMPVNVSNMIPVLETTSNSAGIMSANHEILDLPNIRNLTISERISIEPDKLPEDISLLRVSVAGNITNDNVWFGQNNTELLPKPLVNEFQENLNIELSQLPPSRPVKKKKLQKYSLLPLIPRRLPLQEVQRNLNDIIDNINALSVQNDNENVQNFISNGLIVRDNEPVIANEINDFNGIPMLIDNDNAQNVTPNEFRDDTSGCPIILPSSPIPIADFRNTNIFNESNDSNKSNSSSLIGDILTIAHNVSENYNSSGINDGIIKDPMSTNACVLYCAMTKRYISIKTEFSQIEQIILKENTKSNIPK